MQWFYILDGQRLGPVEESELFRLARDGRLQPGDLVWNPSFGQEWKPASAVPHLFEKNVSAVPATPGTTPNGDLMSQSVAALSGRWALAVGAALLYQVVISGVQFVPYIGILFVFLVSGPMLLGLNRFFLKLSRNEAPDIGQLFDGFKLFGKSLAAYLLLMLFMFLWMLPILAAGVFAGIAVPLIENNTSLGILLIPMAVLLGTAGLLLVIRAALAYSQVFFLLADRPALGAYESIDESIKMMEGFKWKKFCLSWRFLGWALLGILTCGIGFLWLYPYMMTANAKFYDDTRTA